VVQVGDVKRFVNDDTGAVLIGYRTSKLSIHQNQFPIRGEGAYVGAQLNGQSTHHGECTWRTEIDFASTLLDPLDELLVIRHLFVHVILSSLKSVWLQQLKLVLKIFFTFPQVSLVSQVSPKEVFKAIHRRSSCILNVGQFLSDILSLAVILARQYGPRILE
tara:strand:+ start:1296 stop:1781 length:486 start_codon:yes stop_codon:yes gene_type:complete